MDTESYFVSEASTYRILKAHDLISSPAFIVIKAASEFCPSSGHLVRSGSKPDARTYQLETSQTHVVISFLNYGLGFPAQFRSDTYPVSKSENVFHLLWPIPLIQGRKPLLNQRFSTSKTFAKSSVQTRPPSDAKGVHRGSAFKSPKPSLWRERTTTRDPTSPGSAAVLPV